jgi:hypothetical protein
MALFRSRALRYFAMDHAASGNIIMSESYGRIFVPNEPWSYEAQRRVDQSLCVCLVLSFSFATFIFLHFRSKTFL